MLFEDSFVKFLTIQVLNFGRITGVHFDILTVFLRKPFRWNGTQTITGVKFSVGTLGVGVDLSVVGAQTCPLLALAVDLSEIECLVSGGSLVSKFVVERILLDGLLGQAFHWLLL